MFSWMRTKMLLIYHIIWQSSLDKKSLQAKNICNIFLTRSDLFGLGINMKGLSFKFPLRIVLIRDICTWIF